MLRYNFYNIPSLNFLLFFSEIVLISSRVKYFTSDDITFSYFTSDDMIFAVMSASNQIIEVDCFDVK